jgi:hypothetical protein
MNDTLKFDNYDINIEYDEESGELYIKMNDLTSNICYETKYNTNTLDVYFISTDPIYMSYKCLYEFTNINLVVVSRPQLYNIIKNSFNRIAGHTVVITITNGILTLGFVNICDNYTSIQFDLVLKGQPITTTKTITTNKPYTYGMNKLQKQLDRIEKLLDNVTGETDIENPICLFNWNIFGLSYFNNPNAYKEKIKLD